MGDWTLPAVVGALLFLANLAVKVVALGVIPANRKPSTGMAWLLLVLLNTGLGLVAFALFGSPRLDRRRQARQDQAKQRIRERTEEMADVPLDPALPAYVGSVVALNRNLGSLPLLGGNSVELLPDYRESIAAMTAAVGTAECFVDVEFYIAAWDDVTDPFFEALARAASAGCGCGCCSTTSALAASRATRR